MALKCPVSGKTAADAKTAPSEAVAQCPFASAAAQADHSNGTPDTAASEAPLTAGASCPYGFGGSAKPETGSDKEAAVCPMGFGSAKPKDPLAALQCSRCSALFYDAVKIACGHFFCRSCIDNAQDCLLCGADVQDIQPEARLQELVDLYIQLDGSAAAFEQRAELPKGTVTGSHSAALKVQEDSSEQRTDASKHASFLEQQALRSLAGGNVDAAVHRLGLCRDALLEEATASGHSPELCYRLGNVIGTQGTCLEQQGKSEEAAQAYGNSIKQLQKSPEKTAEVVQALAISMNKLGDRKYLDKDLRGAKQHYTEALRVRQDACKSSGPASAEMQLGIVTSLLKVVDVEQALNEKAAAEEHKQKARKALRDAEKTVPQEGPLRAKLMGLRAYLQCVG